MKKKLRTVDYSDIPENLKQHPFYGFILDEEQIKLREAIFNPEKKIIFVDAKAGTGKTLIAVATAILMYKYNIYDGINYIVSACNESRQGFLPGDITAKSAVYFDPLYDAIIKCDEDLNHVLMNDSIPDKEGTAYIKAMTHTFLRGCNMENKVVIIDEAQNYTVSELKKTLTRIHDTSKAIVIGHTLQCDLEDKSSSGFLPYINYYQSLNDNNFQLCELTKSYRGWIATSADNMPE